MQVPDSERRTTRGQVRPQGRRGRRGRPRRDRLPPAGRRRAARSGGRVVVVGAGVAGLTCAHRLRQHGDRLPSTRRPTGSAAARRPCAATSPTARSSSRAARPSTPTSTPCAGWPRSSACGSTTPSPRRPAGCAPTGSSSRGRRYPYRRASRDFAVVYPALQRDLRAFRTLAARRPRARRDVGRRLARRARPRRPRLAARAADRRGLLRRGRRRHHAPGAPWR